MTDKIREQDYLILIVDDIAKNIQLLGKVLDNQGYGVVAVTEGDQVLKAARKHNPDLILLDIMMPGKSGFEVCEELKADEKLSDIPIIFLTARSDEEDIIKGLNLGGADYVTKPFNSGELLARIETHLSLKNARDKIIQQQNKLQQLSATKDKIYSIVAHDLRGSLSGIYGLVEIIDEELDDDVVSEDVKKYIRYIFQGAAASKQILENLLAWTRHQTDSLQMNMEEFSLLDEIETSVQLYQTQAKKKQIDIQFETDEGNMMVRADRQMLATVIRNLLSNAIKFSHSGDQVTLKISSMDGGTLVSVKDEGIGMPEEIRSRIFNYDSRPKRSGTNKEHGTGLGLLLCKDFVEAHNGEIRVNSKPNEGTEFQFEIPH